MVAALAWEREAFSLMVSVVHALHALHPSCIPSVECSEALVHGKGFSLVPESAVQQRLLKGGLTVQASNSTVQSQGREHVCDSWKVSGSKSSVRAHDLQWLTCPLQQTYCTFTSNAQCGG